MAIGADRQHWFLVNASPDVRSQIEGFDPLQPRNESFRDSPLADVLLTNADLDHTLGLVLLREGLPLRVHATGAVRRTVENDLRLGELLKPFGGVSWVEPPSAFEPLALQGGAPSGLEYRAIALANEPPVYAKAGPDAGQSVAYQIRDCRTGSRLLVAPDVGALPVEFTEALAHSDAIFFDGTFWSDTELQKVKAGARTARAMGHLPISDGSLPALRDLPARLKVYLHINNTNPILDPFSLERKAVERAGILVGEDGQVFEL